MRRIKRRSRLTRRVGTAHTTPRSGRSPTSAGLQPALSSGMHITPVLEHFQSTHVAENALRLFLYHYSSKQTEKSTASLMNTIFTEKYKCLKCPTKTYECSHYILSLLLPRVSLKKRDWCHKSHIISSILNPRILCIHAY